uniref:Phospholipase A2 n=1 Tax=Ditylenchus dipsaci TaxID=166011 RepID=A0A915DXM9_9BILA
MYLIKSLIFILLICVLSRFTESVLPNGWACGTDNLNEQIAETIIKNDCPANRDAINACCVAHDACYMAKFGREKCDNVFCNCITAASASNEKCRLIHGPSFCNLVRTFGELAYTMGK